MNKEKKGKHASRKFEMKRKKKSEFIDDAAKESDEESEEEADEDFEEITTESSSEEEEEEEEQSEESEEEEEIPKKRKKKQAAPKRAKKLKKKVQPESEASSSESEVEQKKTKKAVSKKKKGKREKAPKIRVPPKPKEHRRPVQKTKAEKPTHPIRGMKAAIDEMEENTRGKFEVIEEKNARSMVDFSCIDYDSDQKAAAPNSPVRKTPLKRMLAEMLEELPKSIVDEPFKLSADAVLIIVAMYNRILNYLVPKFMEEAVHVKHLYLAPRDVQYVMKMLQGP